MKHLGTHEFTKNVYINEESVYNSSFLNKLNIPLHKDLLGEDFGDLFSEGNSVKFVDNEGNINLILDLRNDDIIKTLILTELMFDDFYNYGETFSTSNSFHDNILFNGVDAKQNTIFTSSDVTSTTDSTNGLSTFILKFVTEDNAVSFYNNANQFISSALPLRTTFINTIDSTSIEQIVLYDSAFLDTTTVTLNVTAAMSIWFDSINTCDVIEISTFDFEDVISGDNIVKLPHHEHILANIKDLVEKTNVNNGYIKLVDDNVRLDFGRWKLWLELGRVSNSVFAKDLMNELEGQTCFILNKTDSTINENVNHTVSTVIMQDSTIFEYDATSVEIEFIDSLELSSKDGLIVKNNTISFISDETSLETDYLVEFIDFKYNDLFTGEDNIAINDVISVRYELINKSNISTIKKYDTNYAAGKISTLSGYYEVSLIQPNINTIPSILISFVHVCKDINDNILLTRPRSITNIVGNTNLNITSRSLLHLELLDTTTELTVEIYEYDILTDSFMLHQVVTDNTTLLVDRGMYKFIASTESYNYNIHYYEG